VSAWLARPNVAVLDPGERHWDILAQLLASTRARGAVVMDAHLAALAIELGRSARAIVTSAGSPACAC
jgi:predicted nucleic acid-binding protein